MTSKPSKPSKPSWPAKQSKSDSTPATNRSARVIGALRAFVAGLSEQAVLDASTGIVIAIAISLLLIHYRRVVIVPLAAGTVAQADVVAPETLKTEDVLETSRQKQQAASVVLPIFDYHPRTDKDATGIINAVFEIGREDQGRSNADKLAANIEQSTGLSMDQEQMMVLVRHRFDRELESLMVAHLEAVMMNGVVTSRTQITRLGSTGFIRRDQKN